MTPVRGTSGYVGPCGARSHGVLILCASCAAKAMPAVSRGRAVVQSPALAWRTTAPGVEEADGPGASRLVVTRRPYHGRRGQMWTFESALMLPDCYHLGLDIGNDDSLEEAKDACARFAAWARACAGPAEALTPAYLDRAHPPCRDRMPGRCAICDLLAKVVYDQGAEEAARDAEAEVARMRPVVEAAVRWHREGNTPSGYRTIHGVADAVSAYLAATPPATKEARP